MTQLLNGSEPVKGWRLLPAICTLALLGDL
jgi:hypothetical protein